MLVIVFGVGFVGKPLCSLLEAGGHRVVPVTRHGGDGLVSCDITEPKALAGLREEVGQVDVMVHCASSGRGGGDPLERYQALYLEGCRNMIRIFSPARLVFAGSTSVYGQTDGSMVDEESPAEPLTETGRVLLETEEAVLGHGGSVARLAGIYGPGRSYLLKRYLGSEAQIDGDTPEAVGRWINQIHHEDAASALAHLAGMGEDSRIYNVCDDTPLQQRACYEELDRRFGRGVPEVRPPDEGRARGWSSKRVSAARLREAGWRPRYCSYFEALDDDPQLLPSIMAS
jgi:nucleoside-diphosphate-sugar epimerase